MASLDVVARLQLRAEQFSSENGKAFAELKTRAASAAQEVRQSFTSSFADVQKIASTALTLPRTQTGSLNLSSEIAELERSAAAAERNAIANRELSVGYTGLAAKAREGAEGLRQSADAAALASLNEERLATELRDRIGVLQLLQKELNLTTSETRQNVSVANDNVVSVGQQRAAFQQLGFQLGDVATQWAANTPPMIIFAQQSGQVVQALQLMTNSTTGLLGFLGGPWGAVLGAAAVVGGTLAAKLYEGSDAAKEKDKAVKQLSESIGSLYDDTLRQVRAEEHFRAATLASANALLVKASAARQDAQASLDTRLSEARARRVELEGQVAVAGYDESGYGARAARRASQEAEVAARQERQLLQEKRQQEARALQAVRAAQLIDANARVTESIDKVAAAEGRNRRAVDGASAAYLAGRITLSEYEAQKRRLDSASQTEIAGLRASERGSRGLTDAQKAERSEKRELAKAAKDAAAAQRELDGSYQSVISSLDPALAATLRYRDTLRDIAALSEAGRISPGQATDYTLRAILAKQEADRRASQDRFREIVGTDVDAELKGIVGGITEGFVQELDPEALGGRLGRGASDELLRAVDSIAYLFGGRIKGPLAAVLQPGGIGREARETSAALVDSIKGLGVDLSDDVSQTLKNGIETAFRGAAFGQVGGSAFSAITGGREDRTASAIGGVLGEVAGKSLSKPIGDAIGGTLGKTLGSAAGPLGAIVGGIAGNLLGGLFGGKPPAQYGTASVQLTGGAIRAGQVSGNSTSAASGLAGSVSKGLQGVADQLGATIRGLPNITFGTYKDQYRVSTTGYSGGPLNFKGSSANGLFDFGSDQEAAIRFAVSQSLAGAVIEGISDASKRILQSGQELESAINKALLIEAVPKDLKAMLDPVGAAVDALNAKFQKTVDALNEGGASAEQLAQAQQLYSLQLAEVKANTAGASKGLQEFLTKLRGGSGSPLSLRDQEAAVRAELSPLLGAIERGERIDQGKYQEVAQRYLDIERELYGSTQAFFDAFDAVQASTTKAIATIDNVVPVGGAVPDPFTKATATAAEKTASGVQTSNELLAQVSDQLAALGPLLERLGVTGAGGSYIGESRGFTKVA